MIRNNSKNNFHDWGFRLSINQYQLQKLENFKLSYSFGYSKSNIGIFVSIFIVLNLALFIYLLGLCNSNVEVHLPGGKLIINWKKEAEVMMEGPIETVFSGVWLDRDNDD